jgi:hypothetical protein
VSSVLEKGLRKNFAHGGMSYQFPNQEVRSPQGLVSGAVSREASVAPLRVGVSAPSMQIQNPLLLFALEDALSVFFQSGDKVLHRGKRSHAIRTPELQFDLSPQAFGIIAVARSAVPAQTTSLFDKVRALFGREPKSDATLFSLSIFPPGAGASPAVLAFIVSNKSEYPEFLNEVFRTPAGVRMAVGTLLNNTHSNNPLVAEIAECLREATFGPAARASAMLPGSYPWSDIAPQVREASLDRFSPFDCSTAEGVYKLREAVKRASLAPSRVAHAKRAA